MTDNEITKAKEHFQYGISHDIFKEPVLSYAKTVLWAFEEINCQKAEVERLTKIVEEQHEGSLIAMEVYKNEAIKEFWEKAKQTREFRTQPYVYIVDGDNLVKEMVGDAE